MSAVSYFKLDLLRYIYVHIQVTNDRLYIAFHVYWKKRRILQRGKRLNVTPPTKLYYDMKGHHTVESNMNKIKNSKSP